MVGRRRQTIKAHEHTPAIVIPYKPRPLQRSLHDVKDRFAVWVCHRRFGKTVMCINELIRAAMTNGNPDPRYAYISPTYKQSKLIAWDYCKRFSAPIPGVKPNEADLRVDLPARKGSGRISLYGADNPDSIRGIYLDGAVLDEYALMSPRIWQEVVRPMLVDRQGWARFIGTPFGHNHFRDLHFDAQSRDDWHTQVFRASETGIIEPDELAAAKREMSEESYEQEFECSFDAQVKGSYYGRLIVEAESQERITRVPYDSHALVHTAWDLGIGDSTAIWAFQYIGKAMHFINHYEANGRELAHYVNVLNEWKKDLGYTYGETHHVPHDAQARELISGKSRLKALQELGVQTQVIENHKVDDRIEAARRMIKISYFDAEKCRYGIDCLRQYRREYNEKSQTFTRGPLHDWASHSADAYGYAAMAKLKTTARARPEPRRVAIV